MAGSTTMDDALAGMESSLEKTRGWVSEVQAELDRSGPRRGQLRPTDPREAYHALRALLHLLRDHLPLPEVADLGAQLPVVLRGLYYEGWRPATAARRDLTAELVRTRVELGRSQLDPIVALQAAFRVLRGRVTSGEVADVTGALPRSLRALLE